MNIGPDQIRKAIFDARQQGYGKNGIDCFRLSNEDFRALRILCKNCDSFGDNDIYQYEGLPIIVFGVRIEPSDLVPVGCIYAVYSHNLLFNTPIDNSMWTYPYASKKYIKPTQVVDKEIQPVKHKTKKSKKKQKRHNETRKIQLD